MEKRAESLLRALESDPKRFDTDGTAYELLQEFFRGLPLSVLNDLLESKNHHTRRVAIWIASELGADAKPLLPAVLSYVDADDRFLAYHALEILVVCAVGDEADEFRHVLKSFQSQDEVIRRLAMRLTARATEEQISRGSSALHNCDEAIAQSVWLPWLEDPNSVPIAELEEALESGSDLRRRCAIVAAFRRSEDAGAILSKYMKHKDEDVRQFCDRLR